MQLPLLAPDSVMDWASGDSVMDSGCGSSVIGCCCGCGSDVDGFNKGGGGSVPLPIATQTSWPI